MDKFRDIPTGLIVFTLIFMWPIGIFLIFLKYFAKSSEVYGKVTSVVSVTDELRKKMSSNKLNKLKAKAGRYKRLTIIFVIIAIVFFIALLSSIAEGDDIEGGVIVNVLIFSIVTPICITYFKTNNLVKKIETYQNLILIRDIYDTKKLADMLKCSRAEVLDFVSYMIREGFLELDIENENIVKPKEYVDPAEIFSFICQTCGANNKYIKGKNNKCEYCGSVLNLNKI